MRHRILACSTWVKKYHLINRSSRPREKSVQLFNAFSDPYYNFVHTNISDQGKKKIQTFTCRILSGIFWIAYVLSNTLNSLGLHHL